jgi:hypothetical protein
MQSECKSMYDASWGRDSSGGWNGAGASSGEWNGAGASNWNWHSANDELPQTDATLLAVPVTSYCCGSFTAEAEAEAAALLEAFAANRDADAPETPPMPSKWSLMGPAIPQIQPLVMTPETPEPRSQEEASVDKGVGKGV